MSPISIWLDCDTGHDDAFAILLAAHHPSAQLLGISTIYGNAPLSKTTYNTRAILTAIKREDIPVYAGAAKPLSRPVSYAPDIHGESGLDGTPSLPTPAIPAKTDKTATKAMYDALIATARGTAWLVCTGALTNAAELFANHPDVIEHIAGVSIMGGAIGGGFTDAPMGMVQGEGERFGNYSPKAEFNIYIDPESAQNVLGNVTIAAKSTLIALDLTHQFRGTAEVQKNLLYGYGGDDERTPSSTRKLFHEILTHFAKTYKDVFGIADGPPVHDPLAVAIALVQPGVFDDRGGERFSVNVVTEGKHEASSAVSAGASADMSECGRTVATVAEPEVGGVRIPRGVQTEAIWKVIDACLAAVDSDSA